MQYDHALFLVQQLLIVIVVLSVGYYVTHGVNFMYETPPELSLVLDLIRFGLGLVMILFLLAFVVPVDICGVIYRLLIWDFSLYEHVVDVCSHVDGYFNYHQLSQIRATPWNETNSSDYIEIGHVVYHRGIRCTDYVMRTVIAISLLLYLVVRGLRIFYWLGTLRPEPGFAPTQ